MRRGAIRCVLDGFLGTFVSRYSDYDGWWLMGFLVGGDEPLVIDLLGAPPAEPRSTPRVYAADLAIDRFADQLRKWHVPREHVRSARLSIETLPGDTRAPHLSPSDIGRTMRFTVCVHSATGAAHELARDVFVAPHDPEWERRRGPENWFRRG